MSRSAIIAALVLAAIGCAPPPPTAPQETAVLMPLHLTASDQQQATAELGRWLEGNVRRPGAVFRLLQAGRDRASARTRFVAAIPRSWGAPNAVGNRVAYVARQRQLFGVAITSPDGVSITTPFEASSEPQVVTLPALDSRGVQWRWGRTTRPAHSSNVCDVSRSAAVGRACTPGALLNSFDLWLPDARAVGSTFRVWIVGTSASNASCVFAVQTPELPIADRMVYLMSARNELANIFDHLPAHAGSAVFAALTVAVADLSARPGTKRLNVLSDLRETSGPWAFDQHIPPPREFSQWLASERLIPDCRDIAVTLCGVHFGAMSHESSFDARRGMELRSVWTQALRAMHPASVEICSECDAAAFTNPRR